MACGHCGMLLDFLCNCIRFIFMGNNWSWDDLPPKNRQLKRTPRPQSSQKNPPKNHEVLNDFMEQIHQNLQGILYRFVLCRCVDALVPHLLSGRIWVDSSNRWLFIESRYLLFPFIKRREHIFILYVYLNLWCFFDSYPQNGSFIYLCWNTPENYLHVFGFKMLILPGCNLTWITFQIKTVHIVKFVHIFNWCSIPTNFS